MNGETAVRKHPASYGRLAKTCAITLSALLLSACASFSGYSGASGKFACKAPDGVSCESMSGIYANAMANNLPGQQVTHKSNKATKAAEPYSTNALTTALSSGQPLRTQAEVTRLWLAPWTDSDGDLHDQKYVYLVTSYGGWNLAHTSTALRSNYSVIKPPESEAAPTGTPASKQQSVLKPGAEASTAAKEAVEQSRTFLNESTAATK